MSIAIGAVVALLIFSCFAYGIGVEGPPLMYVNFQCEPGLGASVMYNLLYNQPQKLMLLAGCSTVCTTVAEAAKMWNLIVVSGE